MPLSSHLLRKLQETLGMEAATDLSSIIETVEATRADVAELRHQMEIEFAKVRAEVKTEATVINTRLDQAVTSARLEHALLIQTRWILGGFALVLIAILFKG
jgi:hypothetical protein